MGFTVRYHRPEDGFAYLEREGAEIMLDQHHPKGRHWLTRPFAPPLGNGLNPQVAVDALARILERFARAGWPLFMPVEDKWYRGGAWQSGQRSADIRGLAHDCLPLIRGKNGRIARASPRDPAEVAVADRDGYLLRLAQRLGSRPA